MRIQPDPVVRRRSARRSARALLAALPLAFVLAPGASPGASAKKEEPVAAEKTDPKPKIAPLRAPRTPIAPRAGAKQTGGTKVDQLVEEIRAARSLAQVRQAHARLRLDEADQEEFARRLSKDRSLAARLRELGRPEIERRKAALAGKGGPKMRAVARPSGVQRLSAEARRAFTPPSEPVLRSGGALGGSRAARVFRVGSEFEFQGDIDGVSPVPAVVGEPVVIRGDDFGTRRGEVFFLYEPERAAFRASVASWSDTRIEVAIPDAVADRAGESRQLFAVRVIPDGADLGPLHDVLVEAAASDLVPAISRVAPGSVMPGQELTLLGQNFLTDSAGSVTFEIGGERIPGAVAAGDWGDAAVVVRLPSDVTGLVAQDATVVLENHRGNVARRAVRFEPILEEQTLAREWEHSCWGLLGHKQTVTHHDFTLANQWEVVESSLVGDAMGWFGPTSGVGGGCVEQRAPSPGSSSPAYRFEGWCNALNIVWCNTRVELRGPRGTEPR